MKISNAAAILALFTSCTPREAMAFSEGNEDGLFFKPLQVSFDSLVDDRSFENVRRSIWDALTEVGMVSITNVPGLNKQDMLSALHPCAASSEATLEQVQEDGTHRLTFATHSTTGKGGNVKINHGTGADCSTFSKTSDSFRDKAATVTSVFSKRLSSILQEHTRSTHGPLLKAPDGSSFKTFTDVVENGQHLEHFHSYYHPENEDLEEQKNTIEWHTDQGLFIVFTPAQVTQGTSLQRLSEGFYIESEDGTKKSVQFGAQDDLVIMLGDGVNQYINQAISKTSRLLRTTRHAVKVPSLGEGESRVWYGRMVLPPKDAIHPIHGETFGQLRKLMVSQTTEKQNVLSLGCSSVSNTRQLETTSCEDQPGTMYCWHRCMSLEEQGVSESICAERNLDLSCVNPRGQLWDNSHGDFFPGCVDLDTAENRTAFPALPNFPRSEEECTPSGFESFVGQGDSYDHTLDLEDGAIFKWSVLDDRVKGRLMYNGIFGFLAVGLPMEGGAKNGMHGARIIMALPGGNYSAAYGVDMSLDATIEEYVIDPNGAKKEFRHWMTPVSSSSTGGDVSTARSGNLESYAVDYDECFTEITFETNSIHDYSFNLTGTDRLIWAANSKDRFVGGHNARGHMFINWATGEASIKQEDLEKTASSSSTTPSPSSTTPSPPSATALRWSPLTMIIVLVVTGMKVIM